MGLQVVSSTICQIFPLKRIYIFRYLFIASHRQCITYPSTDLEVLWHAGRLFRQGWG